MIKNVSVDILLRNNCVVEIEINNVRVDWNDTSAQCYSLADKTLTTSLVISPTKMDSVIVLVLLSITIIIIAKWCNQCTSENETIDHAMQRFVHSRCIREVKQNPVYSYDTNEYVMDQIIRNNIPFNFENCVHWCDGAGQEGLRLQEWGYLPLVPTKDALRVSYLHERYVRRRTAQANHVLWALLGYEARGRLFDRSSLWNVGLPSVPLFLRTRLR